MTTTSRAGRSLTGAVLSELRSEIMAGRHAPGSRLSPRALADRFDVSLTVVREALTRLTDQGLAVSEAQHGFAVVNLDLPEVRDIARVRVLIEGEALRDAIDHAGVEYEALVLASHHRLLRTPERGAESGLPTDDWARAHAQFHTALLRACSSPRLRELATGLRDMTELSRRWSDSFATQQPMRDVLSEHRGLMEAAIARDSARAVALLTDHINLTTDRLEQAASVTEPEGRPRIAADVVR